jgi:hypothetical protein
MLPFAVADQGFKLIPRGHAKVAQDDGSIHHLQLATGYLEDA